MDDQTVDNIVNTIRSRLEELLERKDMSRRQLAHNIGIHEDLLGKMTHGKRPWKLRYLKKVADGLDMPLDNLLSEEKQIPIVADLGEDLKFDYHRAVDLAPHETMVYPTLPQPWWDKAYFLRVETVQYAPNLVEGAILVVVRGLGSAENLRDNDLVVYVGDDNQGYLKRVKWAGEQYIVFCGINQRDEMVVRLADAVRGVDLVVAILPRIDLMGQPASD